MTDEVNIVLTELKEQSEKCLHHLHVELAKLRAGKAMPSMLDGITTEYYGSKVPLTQVANISTPDAKTIMVKPWEKSMIVEIEKAIMYANIGLNPQNDGEQVIINIPPLTEERRIQLVKQAKNESENGKIGLRSARKDALDMIKQLQKDGLSEDLTKDAENDVQAVIDDYSKRIDDTIVHKEKEIMTI